MHLIVKFAKVIIVPVSFVKFKNAWQNIEFEVVQLIFYNHHLEKSGIVRNVFCIAENNL